MPNTFRRPAPVTRSTSRTRERIGLGPVESVREAERTEGRGHSEHLTLRAPQSQQSIARASERLASILALPCAVHDAEAGVHCWRGSGVRGLCQPRYRLATGYAAAPRVLGRGGAR